MLFGDSWEAMQTAVVGFLPRLLSGVLIFGAFWLAAQLLDQLLQRLGSLRKVDPSLMRFLGRSARFGILLFGLVTALGTLGIDVAALVAGLGLTGFALGFALKDVVSNVMAGVLLLIYKPFEVGWRIRVGAFEGTVTQIDMRYTVLEAGEKWVFVPNSLLFTNAITVETNTPQAA